MKHPPFCKTTCDPAWLQHGYRRSRLCVVQLEIQMSVPWLHLIWQKKKSQHRSFRVLWAKISCLGCSVYSSQYRLFIGYSCHVCWERWKHSFLSICSICDFWVCFQNLKYTSVCSLASLLQLDVFFFQSVRAICDGPTNSFREADDELPGQRQTGNAERCGTVSQGDPGDAAHLQDKCISPTTVHILNASTIYTCMYNNSFMFVGAEEEAEGVGEQGHAVQSHGWREDKHQTGTCVQEQRGSSAQKTANCSQAQ